MRVMNSGRSQTGFTIVELLIVVVVIAILASVAIVAYVGVTARTKESIVASDLGAAVKQLEVYKVDYNSYPATLASVNGSKGIKTSPIVSLQYSKDANSYCLTAYSGTIAYKSQGGGSAQKGACQGHTAKALNCPAGFVPVAGNTLFGTSDFCVMKYEAKNVGGVPTSQAAGLPWHTISATAANTASGSIAAGCRLITDDEWLTIAHSILITPANWSDGAVGQGALYSGHNDGDPYTSLAASDDDTDGYFGTNNSAPSNQRRTLYLANGSVVWDMVGNLYDWTTGSTTSQPGFTGSGRNWWQFNNVGVQGSDPKIFPAFGNPAAASYTSAQGIGMVYSSADETSVNAYIRGGHYYNGSTTAGIFMVNPSGPPSNASANRTFRSTCPAA